MKICIEFEDSETYYTKCDYFVLDSGHIITYDTRGIMLEVFNMDFVKSVRKVIDEQH